MKCDQQGNNSLHPPPFDVKSWGLGWWLCGNGPSYLLFRAKEGRVMHLSSAVTLALREALKGYQVIQDGKLLPLVQHLVGIDAANNSDGCEEANRAVLVEIERLIFKTPEAKIFKGRLARVATLITAARRIAMLYQLSDAKKSLDKKRCKLWFSDAHGRELLITDYADGHNQCTLSCVTDSKIAGCALALWNTEEKSFGGGAKSLYRVPTRKELREHLCLDDPAVTKLCRAQGFEWLPRAARGQTSKIQDE